MSEWIIEPLQLERDLNDVAALEAACFTNPTTREMLRHEVESSDVLHAYVMREASAAAELIRGAVVAYCSVWIIFDELHINTLAVAPAARRRGLATALLRHILADAAAAGATKATLEVRASNTAALALYGRLGFHVAATRPGYYVKPAEDALILWRERLDTSP